MEQYDIFCKTITFFLPSAPAFELHVKQHGSSHVHAFKAVFYFAVCYCIIKSFLPYISVRFKLVNPKSIDKFHDINKIYYKCTYTPLFIFNTL